MLALTNVRDDIVIRSLVPETPVRRVSASTASGAYRSPATEAMLEILVGAGRRYAAEGRDLAVAS